MTQQQQEQEYELFSHLTAGENQEKSQQNRTDVEPVSNQCVCKPCTTLEEQPFKPL